MASGPDPNAYHNPPCQESRRQWEDTERELDKMPQGPGIDWAELLSGQERVPTLVGLCAFCATAACCLWLGVAHPVSLAAIVALFGVFPVWSDWWRNDRARRQSGMRRVGRTRRTR